MSKKLISNTVLVVVFAFSAWAVYQIIRQVHYSVNLLKLSEDKNDIYERMARWGFKNAIPWLILVLLNVVLPIVIYKITNYITLSVAVVFAILGIVFRFVLGSEFYDFKGRVYCYVIFVCYFIVASIWVYDKYFNKKQKPKTPEERIAELEKEVEELKKKG